MRICLLCAWGGFCGALGSGGYPAAGITASPSPVPAPLLLPVSALSRCIYVGKDRSGDRADTRSQEEYLLVDGYNIIFAWDSLKELAQVNLDSQVHICFHLIPGHHKTRPMRTENRAAWILHIMFRLVANGFDHFLRIMAGGSIRGY